MKKYFLILIAMVFLLSCGEEDPCDITYKLNELGGYGRNEVTFMLGDEIWYSKGSGSLSGGMGGGISGSSGGFRIAKNPILENGKIKKDSLGNIVYKDYYSAGFETSNSIDCENNKFFKHGIIIGFSGFSESIDTINVLQVRMYIANGHEEKAKIYNTKNSSTFSGKVYLDKVNKICYGELEAILYETEKIDGKFYIKDSIQLKNCVFDYKYKEIKNGEIEQ